MTDYKINQDIRNLLKMGLPEDMATIVAYANNGKSEEVQHLVCTIEQEHDLLKKELQNFVPFHENNNTDKCFFCNFVINNNEDHQSCDRCDCLICDKCFENDKLVYHGNQFECCADCGECDIRREKLNNVVNIIDESDKKDEKSDLQHQQ